jgi:nicotinamidase-related amidase
MPANPARTSLSPDNHSLLVIDHKYLQVLTIRPRDASELIDHAVALIKAATIFDVPMLTATALTERQGLVAPAKAVRLIDRTTLNAWEDPRVADWVEKTGRQKLVIAGQWTELCVAMPVLSALEAGYHVYIVTDACGGSSREAHTMAMEKMVQAGACPITTADYVSELQRDWTRAANAEQFTRWFALRGGAFGQGPLWEWDLLNLKEGTC